MLGAEGIVSPEAQNHLGKRHGCIMILKNKTRMLIWDRLPKEWECETYIERDFTVQEQELIEMVGLGNMEKIQAILSNYY